MPILQTIITDFSGGLTEDKRQGWVSKNGINWTTNKFSLTKHFDVFDYPHKLVPYILTEAEEDKTFEIRKFLYAPATAAGAGLYRLYGFGGKVGSLTKPKVYWNNLDYATGWGTPSKGESTVTNKNYEVFFYYKNYIYMWTGAQYLVRYDTTQVADFNNAYYDATSYTNVAQPVHHPADDCAYFFHDNFVHQLNDTVWDDKVLTLPSNLKITSACAYGNYLAIACTTLGSVVNSVVYLWDRDSSLATLSEIIDFGEGEIRHLANLNNKLIAVMEYYLNSDYGLRKGKILIKQVSGNFAVVLNQITTDDLSGVLPRTRMVKDNKLYFPAAPELNGDTRLGIWVVNDNGQMTLDFIEEEATSYEGIYSIGNFWWIAHSGDGSVNRSDNNFAYSSTNPSVYESLIFNAGDSDLTKKLIGATVMTEKKPAVGITGAKVILKYRKDGDTTWIIIHTDTAEDSIGHGSINIEADGSNLPEYKEIEFRIESYSGAVITGLKFKSEIVSKELY